MSTSRSLNKVILIGNLTRDPVLRSTAKNSSVCTFGLATNSSWRDAAGGTQERTEFHNVVAWNKLAEICVQLLSVGMSVYIEGELRTRTWTDQNGVRHFRTEIKALDMKLLDNKNKKGVGMEAAKKNAGTGEDIMMEEEGNMPIQSDDVSAVNSVSEAPEMAAPVKEANTSGEDLF